MGSSLGKMNINIPSVSEAGGERVSFSVATRRVSQLGLESPSGLSTPRVDVENCKHRKSAVGWTPSKLAQRATLEETSDEGEGCPETTDVRRPRANSKEMKMVEDEKKRNAWTAREWVEILVLTVVLTLTVGVWGLHGFMFRKGSPQKIVEKVEDVAAKISEVGHENEVVVKEVLEPKAHHFTQTFHSRPFGLIMWRDVNDNNCVIIDSKVPTMEGMFTDSNGVKNRLRITKVQGKDCRDLPFETIVKMVVKGGMPMRIEFGPFPDSRVMKPLPAGKPVSIWKKNNKVQHEELKFLSQADKDGFRYYEIPKCKNGGFWCPLCEKHGLKEGSMAYGCQAQGSKYENYGCCHECIVSKGEKKCKSTLIDMAEKKLGSPKGKEIAHTFTKRPFGLTCWRDVNDCNAIITKRTKSAVSHIPEGYRIIQIGNKNVEDIRNETIISLLKNSTLPLTLKFGPFDAKLVKPVPNRPSVSIWTSNDLLDTADGRLTHKFESSFDKEGFALYRVPSDDYYCMLCNKSMKKNDLAYGCQQEFEEGKRPAYHNHGCCECCVRRLGVKRAKAHLKEIKHVADNCCCGCCSSHTVATTSCLANIATIKINGTK